MFTFNGKSPGFTLIELLITIIISGVMITIGAVKYRDFANIQTAKSAVATMKNDLRNIQGSASSGLKPADCGLETLAGYRVSYVNQTTYQAQAYCDSNPIGLPTKYILPLNIIFPQSFPDILFKPIAEGANSSTIFLKNQKNGKCYSINVTTTGNINDNGVVGCP